MVPYLDTDISVSSDSKILAVFYIETDGLTVTVLHLETDSTEHGCKRYYYIYIVTVL